LQYELFLSVETAFLSCCERINLERPVCAESCHSQYSAADGKVSEGRAGKLGGE